ncbi:Methylase involved in ubiquinone/menaquinone biosynthesis [Thioalkalivibrio sp. ALE21]|uniref:class I SAM-dependent methyltransferase n=1 Tax=Thioalkalivibrio sp. ALE21 TaxID=1158175 RepID=UPI000D95EA3E|nr:class I SAM-dependent methyltransferase [Thioalkalivibrio sp. ALE21]PYF99751.1 Methylase involved in ubiquinone/menaquinone biosynthesis [Thioalkalivibrio sp. ALE21]
MASYDHFVRSLLTYKHQEWKELSGSRCVRILDVGCGKGRLIAAMQSSLQKLFPDLDFEIHGLEVTEHCGAREGYFDEVVEDLSQQYPGLPWREQFHLCSDGESWPFEDGYFDAIVFSQVIEHVRDHELFFAQHARVLSENGVGVHQFPLREKIKDGHLYLPYVHRIRDYAFLQSYIRFMSRLGFGKFRGEYKREKLERGFGLEDYVNYQSEYAWYQLNYLSRRETLALAKRHRMKGDFLLTNSWIESRLSRLRLCRTDPSTGFNLILLRKFHFLIPWKLRRGSGTLVLKKSRLKRYGVWC